MKARWPWLLCLVALGSLGLYLGAPDAGELRVAWARVAGEPAVVIAIIVGGALGLVATEALRIAVIGRLVGARVGARDAWDAAVANHLMTAITPQVGLGEPTVAYTLGKRGVPWDAAVAIPFLKFTSSLALVFALGAVLVLAGLGPPVDRAIAAAAVALFVAIAAIATLVLALAARPARAHRVIDRVAAWLGRRKLFANAAWIANAAGVARKMIDRLAGVRRNVTWGWTLAVGTVHLVYYASYIAPLVGLALVLGHPPVIALAARALVYLCFVFAMPTPGGAGPSEAAAGVFFGDLVAPADAIVVVVVFRAATFYLQLAIGLLVAPVRAAQGITMIELVPWIAAGVMMGAFVIEALISYFLLRHRHYAVIDTFVSVAISIGYVVSRIAIGAFVTIVLYAVYALTPLRWSMAHWWQWVVLFFVEDFFYYWSHRASHTFRWLWASHAVHHNSPKLNLSTGLRNSWVGGWIDWVFVVPVVALGFHPLALGAVVAVASAWDFMTHTPYVGKVWWLDAWANSPSNHRVHHAKNPIYLDKNVGGALIIWDRMFGTYAAETEAPQYGIDDMPKRPNNPFYLELYLWGDLIRRAFRRRA